MFSIMCRFCFSLSRLQPPVYLHSFPTRRSSDLFLERRCSRAFPLWRRRSGSRCSTRGSPSPTILCVAVGSRSEEHTSELQSHSDLVCRLLLEKKKKKRM